MKFKYIIAIVVTAVVTLSFTFISTSNSKPVAPTTILQDSGAPVGGLVADDSF